MKIRKLLSAALAMTMIMSAFAATASAKINSNDTAEHSIGFEDWADGAITIAPTEGEGKLTDSAAVGYDEIIAFNRSGTRMQFVNFSIAEETGNKYLTGELLNTSDAESLYQGGFFLGKRNTSRIRDSIGKPWVAEVDVRFYNDTRIFVFDGLNQPKGSGNSTEYLTLKYDVDTETATWKGDDNTTAFKISKNEWHNIALVLDTSYEGSDQYSRTIYSKVTLYVDGTEIGSYEETEEAVDTSKQQRYNFSYMAFGPRNKNENAKIDYDNFAIYTVAADEANTVAVTADKESVDLNDGAATVTLSAAVLHNADDKLDITSVYGTPVFSVDPAVEGVSIDGDVLTIADTVTEEIITVTCTVGEITGTKEIAVVPKSGQQATTVQATNIGVFEGDTDGSKATAFEAELNDITGSVELTVVSGSLSKNFAIGTTFTDANVVLGIIVNDLYDEAATATVTVK